MSIFDKKIFINLFHQSNKRLRNIYTIVNKIFLDDLPMTITSFLLLKNNLTKSIILSLKSLRNYNNFGKIFDQNIS